MGNRVLVIERNGFAPGRPAWPSYPADDEVRIAHDSLTAWRTAREWCPDVAIVRTDLLAVRDVALLRGLAEHPSGSPPALVLIAACDDTELLLDAVRAGARGFLSPGTAAETVRKATRTVLDGGAHLGPEAADRLLGNATSREAPDGGAPAHPAASTPAVPRPYATSPARGTGRPFDHEPQRLLAEDAAAIPLLLEALSHRVSRHLDRLAGHPPPAHQPPHQSPHRPPRPAAPPPPGGSRVVAVAALDGAEGLPEQVRERLAESGTPLPVARTYGAVLVVAPERVWRKVALSLLALERPVHLGVSETLADDDDLDAATADALAALRQLRHHAAPPGSELSAAEFTLPMWLADAAHRAALSRRIPESFVRLREHPTLSSTLAAWLVHDCDVRRVASSLHIHPNTVRYRLSRVEQITQQSLSEMPVLTALYLTVLAFPATMGLPPETVGLIHATARR
ncbi:helix-turn-helix domain-containing protein [Streptomyces sp. NPDC054796]